VIALTARKTAGSGVGTRHYQWKCPKDGDADDD
jgi:hypothetical protein